MPRTLFLSLIVVVVALSHMCAADLSIRWAYNVPNGQILERLAVSSDMSFVVSSVEFAASSFLYAFSADPGTTSGALLWQIQAHSETAHLGRPSISPDGKYVAVGCQNCALKNVFVFAINSNSPSLLWSSQLKFGTNILAFEGIPGWRPDSSAVYFQDTSYGQLVEFQVSGQTVTQVTIGTGGGPSSPAMSQDGKYLYVCASKGGAIVKGILAQYTLPLQSNPAPSSQLVTPAPCGSTGRLTSTNMLYIGDNGGLNAIDTSNGVLTRKWYYPTASVPVYSAPAIVSYTSSSSPSQQVVVVFGNNITSLAIDTGAYLWSATADGQIQGAPASIFNSVYVGSLGGDVVSFNVDYQGSAGSGNPAWLNAAKSSDIFRVDGPVGSSLNKIYSDDNPAIVFGTQTGTIWCLDSNSYPTVTDSLPVWAFVLICISCFIGGVVVSAMFVFISKRLSSSNQDSMKKPLLSHHDAL